MRIRDKTKSREAILDAALELFVDKGFSAVPISAIACKSGVTKGLIHHHFGSKDDLWDAVKERSLQGYIDAQLELLAQMEATPENLQKSMRDYFDYLRANPDVVRLMSWTAIEGDHSMVARNLAGPGAEKIATAQQRGLIREDIDPTQTLMALIGVITHWFQARQVNADWARSVGVEIPDSWDEDFFNNFILLAFQGLLPR